MKPAPTRSILEKFKPFDEVCAPLGLMSMFIYSSVACIRAGYSGEYDIGPINFSWWFYFLAAFFAIAAVTYLAIAMVAFVTVVHEEITTRGVKLLTGEFFIIALFVLLVARSLITIHAKGAV